MAVSPNIDLGDICPELAEVIAEIRKVEEYFTPGVEPKAIQNTEVRLTFSEAKAIAATMLKLAAENEQRRNILDDMWPMITAEQRLRINVKYMEKELAIPKGDPGE